MPSTITCNNCGAANQLQASYCHVCGRALQAQNAVNYHSGTGQLLANSLLKQRYRVTAPIGKGGMGAVYQAEDTYLGDRQVALKEMSQSGLSPQEQQEAADAFKQEALMLARLQHSHLPSIFDHFEENGRWYLAMSFIVGESLEVYASKVPEGRLALDEALHIGIEICTVLDYLHNQQPAIIFRDLKPSNIMRTSSGTIYLIDFGIARLFKLGKAKDTVTYGSAGYAPPEQYGKAQTTPRSDIYSLGATLHQLLTGHDPSSTPFSFPPLQSLVPTVPTGLATLIAQMLELDGNKRPASMLLIKQELQALTSSQEQQKSAPAKKEPTHPEPDLPPIPEGGKSEYGFYYTRVVTRTTHSNNLNNVIKKEFALHDSPRNKHEIYAEFYSMTRSLTGTQYILKIKVDGQMIANFDLDLKFGDAIDETKTTYSPDYNRSITLNGRTYSVKYQIDGRTTITRLPAFLTTRDWRHAFTVYTFEVSVDGYTLLDQHSLWD